MFNVLCWNIQFFTEKRINDPSGASDQERQNNADRTLANIWYIVSTIAESGADIVSILEPRCSHGDVEKLATGNGPNGLLYLLALLRHFMPQRNWCLVPPLRLNPRDHIGQISTYTECVGVFWSDTNLAFSGPKRWPAGQTNASGPPIAPGGLSANYPPPWDAAVPVNLQAAAQCRFFETTEILFPDDYNRRPFYTTFQERAAPYRTLRLFSVHTSPATATTAVANMWRIAERLPGNGEVSLIIGDLNLDLNALSSEDGAVLQVWLAWDKFGALNQLSGNGFYPTRVLPAVGNGAATPAAYLTTQTLDFGFVKWGPNGKHNQFATAVVDRVLPQPVPFTSNMMNALPLIRNVQDEQVRNAVFQQRWDYGHIAQPRRNDPQDDAPADGTSDHIPILVSV